jgi:hypothetical protein
VTLSQEATVEQAKEQLARQIHCQPDELHIFSFGRKLPDSQPLKTIDFSQRKPVVYRHIPIGVFAPDPPDFEEKIDNLLIVVDNRLTREVIAAYLRRADYDEESLVEQLLTLVETTEEQPEAPAGPPPSADVPPDIWRQLEQVKPSNVPMEQAIELYEICGNDLEMTIRMLRNMGV